MDDQSHTFHKCLDFGTLEWADGNRIIEDMPIEHSSYETAGKRGPRLRDEIIDVKLKKSEERRLGLTLKTSDDDSSQILIRKVIDGSIAHMANLKQGDQVVKINSISIGIGINLRELANMIKNARGTIDLRIVRTTPEEYKSSTSSTLSDDLPDMDDIPTQGTTLTDAILEHSDSTISPSSPMIRKKRRVVSRLPREQETPVTEDLIDEDETSYIQERVESKYFERDLGTSRSELEASTSKYLRKRLPVTRNKNQGSYIQERVKSKYFERDLGTSRSELEASTSKYLMKRLPVTRNKSQGGIKNFWVSEEDDFVILGVKTWGSGNWAKIKEMYFKDSHRTNINIKDRARLLVRDGFLPKPTKIIGRCKKQNI